MVFTSIYCFQLCADGFTFNPTSKHISTFENTAATTDIIHSQSTDILIFSFTGEPKKNIYHKTIQVFTPLWKLKPGSYTLTIKAKTNGAELQCPMALFGLNKGDQTVESIAPMGQRTIGSEWSDLILFVELPKKMSMGHLQLRVGNVTKGTEIEIKSAFEFKPKS